MKYCFLAPLFALITIGINAQVSENDVQLEIANFFKTITEFKKVPETQKAEQALKIAGLAKKLPDDLLAASDEDKALDIKKLQALLESLKLVETQIIPDFDFESDKNSFTINVAPPAGTGLPSGVAPSAIKDVTLRAQYEADIKANHLKAEILNNQLALRHESESLVIHIQIFIINRCVKKERVKEKDVYFDLISKSELSKELQKLIIADGRFQKFGINP